MKINKYLKELFRDLTSFGGFLFYAILILFFFLSKNFVIALQLFVGILFIYAIIVSIRLFYFKERPKRVYYRNIVEKIDASSFPSIHSARIVFLALVLIYNFDNTLLTNILIALVAIVACYSRIYLKKHDYADVFGGVIVGSVCFAVTSFLL